MEGQLTYPEVKEIVRHYVSKYTCAVMADRVAEVEEETKEANDWIIEQKKNYIMSNEDIERALDELCAEAKEQGTAFCCDANYCLKEIKGE